VSRQLKRNGQERSEKLAKSIMEDGIDFNFTVWRDKVNKKWYLIDGHGRDKIIRFLVDKEGWTCPPVPCVETFAKSLKEAKKKVLRSSSTYHKITNQGLYEFAESLEMEPDEIEDYELPDLDTEAWKDEYYNDHQDVEGQNDIPAIPKKAKSKRGELYLLGEHRLLIDDCTVKDNVDRLMNGEKADLWITDPPYGVSYSSNGNEDKHAKIANDSMPIEEMKKFWTSVCKNAINYCSDESAYYWFACQGGDQMMMMMMAISDAGWKVRHELIWAKDSLVMGRCDYHYQHEPIFYGWKLKGKHHWYSDRKQTSLLKFARPKSSDLHPTMKPVELVAYLINNSSKPKQIVLETFCGSGTTLIACEKTRRKCFAMELEPLYGDVIIQRFIEFSKKPVYKLDGNKKIDVTKLFLLKK
jgi:DNA modification methylase